MIDKEMDTLDSNDWIQLLVIIVLILLSAFFSSAETALTTVSSLRIKTLIDEGNKTAVILQKIKDNTGKMLSAILIGNNIVNISASSLVTVWVTNVFGSRAIGYGTGILTLVVLLFGEISPKTIATLYAEQLSLQYARIIYILMILLTPVIYIVSKLSALILKLLKIDPTKKNTSYTENDLRTIVDVSHEEGVIEREERQMIKNVFDFGDVCARDIMVPRIDMVMAPIDITYEELIALFEKERFTRIPVYETTDEQDNSIVGIVNMKDILLYRQDTPFQIRDYLREPLFIYEYKNISELLMNMRSSSMNLSIVLDEYGDVAGLITLEDILEELVGEIRDEYDSEEDNSIQKINEKTYILDGSLNLEDINDLIGTDFHSDHYDSIGGLIIETLDKLPDVGDSAVINDFILTVTEKEKNRISQVRIQFPESKPSESEKDNATD